MSLVIDAIVIGRLKEAVTKGFLPHMHVFLPALYGAAMSDDERFVMLFIGWAGAQRSIRVYVCMHLGIMFGAFMLVAGPGRALLRRRIERGRVGSAFWYGLARPSAVHTAFAWRALMNPVHIRPYRARTSGAAGATLRRARVGFATAYAARRWGSGALCAHGSCSPDTWCSYT